uniref:Uncharacterized protein n=1 Tax=Rangifer tarandus platyrhynchus TaxID=3082113 RepID=A0ACB0F450_RANTA|nr:unnamed protein product [Rangifer tarandus platyrhynchus]
MFENKRNKLGKRWLGRPCSACLHLRPIKAEAFAVLAGPSLEITRGSSAVFPPERLERSLTQEASVWLSDGSETPVCVPSMQFL